MAKAWLRQRWVVLLSELRELTVDQEDRICELCEAEIAAWKARPTMKSLSSLKEPMTDTRNEIRTAISLTDQNSYWNEKAQQREHLALKYLNYSDSEWVEMNKPTEDRFHARLENQQVIEDADAVVAKARELLISNNWPDLVVGLAVTTGRRLSEVMKVGELRPKTLYTVVFSGQLKRKDEVLKPYEIPVLCEASLVLSAWERLRKMVDCSKMETDMIGKTYDKAVGEAANRHFFGLVPVRDNRDSLFAHLFRDVYPCLAVFYFAPEGVHDLAYLPTILGHYWSARGDGDQQRNYQSSLRYLAYRVSDADVYKHKGKRQGVRLGEPGVEVLEVFKQRTAPAGQKKEKKVVETFLGIETKKKHSATQLSQETKSRLDQVQKDLKVRTQDEAMAAAIDSYYVLQQIVQLVQPLYAELGVDNPVGAVQSLLGEGGAKQIDQRLSDQFGAGLAGITDILIEASHDAPADKKPAEYLRELVENKRTFKKSYEKRHEGKDYSTMTTTALRNTKTPGATQERFRRGVDAMMAYNDQVDMPELRWFINAAMLAELVGGKPSLASEYLDSRREEIGAHHTKHGIKQGHNRRSVSIKDRVVVPELPVGSSEPSPEGEPSEEGAQEE